MSIIRPPSPPLPTTKPLVKSPRATGAAGAANTYITNSALTGAPKPSAAVPQRTATAPQRITNYNPQDPFGFGPANTSSATTPQRSPEQLQALGLTPGSGGMSTLEQIRMAPSLNPGSQQARSGAMVDYWNQHPQDRLAQDLNPMLGPASNLRDAMASLSGGNMGAGGGGGMGGGTGFTGGGGTGGSLPYMMSDSLAAPTPPDMSAANAAVFGRAKDQAGQTGRASLQSLRDELGATGMLGSGAEAQGVRDITQSAAGQLGDVTRDQAIQGANQQADFAQMGYQGQVAMRGQDVQAQGDRARIELQRQLAQQQLLQSALAGLAQAY